MNPWLVYLFVKLDSISSLFLSLAIAVFIILGIILMITVVHSDVENKKWLDIIKPYSKNLKRMMILSFVAIFIWLTFPTSKQFAAIYLIPKIVNNQELQQVPADVVKLLRGKLQEWLSDAEDAAKKR